MEAIMPDNLETLRDILQEALGIKVPITDAEAVAARLASHKTAGSAE
jgi:hypothetical protein